MPQLLALYAGRAGTLATTKGPVRTAIAKQPVRGRARVGSDGLAGDEQISPGHGGPDRALCVYPREHYARWAARVEPAFGENITSEGVLEAATRIGEVWRIGSTLVQVAEWRVKTAPRVARAAGPRHRSRTASIEEGPGPPVNAVRPPVQARRAALTLIFEANAAHAARNRVCTALTG